MENNNFFFFSFSFLSFYSYCYYFISSSIFSWISELIESSYSSLIILSSFSFDCSEFSLEFDNFSIFSWMFNVEDNLLLVNCYYSYIIVFRRILYNLRFYLAFTICRYLYLWMNIIALMTVLNLANTAHFLY